MEDVRDRIVATARSVGVAEKALAEARARWATKRKALNAALTGAIESEATDYEQWRARVLYAWQEHTTTTAFAKEQLAIARDDLLKLKAKMSEQIETMDQLSLEFGNTHMEEQCISTSNSPSET